MSLSTLISRNHRYITLSIFYITIFSLSWNLFRVWRIESAYVNGHFIDYLAPKVYISQVFIWILWAWTLISTRGRARLKSFFSLKQPVSLWLLAFGGILGWQIFNLHDISFVSWIFNFFSGPMLLVMWIMVFHKLIFGPKFLEFFLLAIIVSTTFQSLLGLTQFATQTSQTPYWLMGEPLFAPNRGLAISDFSSIHLVLPYATTPHPNILASWIIIGMLASGIIWYMGKYRNLLLIICFFFQSLSLWLTESWTAWLSLPILAWITWYAHIGSYRKFGFSSFKKVIWSIFIVAQTIWLSIWLWLPAASRLFPVENLSISRRIHLGKMTLNSLRWYPFGQNLGEYFQAVYQAETNYVGNHFLQPVHHAGQFFVIYFGIWTILLFLLFNRFAYKYYSMFFILLLALLPIFNLDHYLLSLLSGQFLLVYLFVIYFFLTNNTSPNI